jgi:hypothetical protein
LKQEEKATDWALNNLVFSSEKKKILIAWSHYFCGIHEYLDNKRGAAIKEAIMAIKRNGIKKHFLLYLLNPLWKKNWSKRSDESIRKYSCSYTMEF